MSRPANAASIRVIGELRAGITRHKEAAKEIEMVWVIGGAILYFVLIVTLGVMTIRKGHWVIFVIGIFLPFFWLIGAVMPSRRAAY